MFKTIDSKKAKELFTGVIGIYITFIASGLFYEMLTKLPFLNIYTNQEQHLRSSAGFNLINKFMTCVLAIGYNWWTIKPQEKVVIAKKNTAICGFIVFVSSITFVESIYLVSFPFISMAKSFGLLNVILVGVLCSRVQSKKLKLGHQKIIIAIVVSLGIVMFRFFDPEANFQDQKQTQFFGFFMLLLSLLADGFLPDFQAEIKEKFKPNPNQMLHQINTWTFIWCFAYAIIRNQCFSTLQYCMSHPMFVAYMVLFSVMTFIGQVYIYQLIKGFQQHIVPFVVTTRKIFTVGISLLYFHHQTSIGQIFGILIVLSVTTFEFFNSITKQSNKLEPAKIQQTCVNKEEIQNPQIDSQHIAVGQTSDNQIKVNPNNFISASNDQLEQIHFDDENTKQLTNSINQPNLQLVQQIKC